MGTLFVLALLGIAVYFARKEIYKEYIDSCNGKCDGCGQNCNQMYEDMMNSYYQDKEKGNWS